MQDLLQPLVLGTHALRLLLAGLLCAIVLVGTGTSSEARRRGWLVLAVFYVVLALDNVLVEVLRRTLGGGHAGYLQVYNQTYLLNSVLSYALPGALLAVLAEGPRLRRAGALAAVLLGVAAALMVRWRPPEDWQALFSITRVLSMLGIAGYLALLALLVLGRLPAAGRHLGAVVGLRAAFVLLVPVNEAFFDWLERSRAEGGVPAGTTLSDYWLLLQLLQFLTTLAAAAVVLHALRVRR